MSIRPQVDAASRPALRDADPGTGASRLQSCRALGARCPQGPYGARRSPRAGGLERTKTGICLAENVATAAQPPGAGKAVLLSGYQVLFAENPGHGLAAPLAVKSLASVEVTALIASASAIPYPFVGPT